MRCSFNHHQSLCCQMYRSSVRLLYITLVDCIIIMTEVFRNAVLESVFPFVVGGVVCRCGGT